MPVRPPRWLALVVVALVVLVSCKKTIDSIVTPDTDTTAPEVVGSDPSHTESDISLTGDIRITFSEAMDPATADGNVTLSSGTIVSLTWETDRILVITHSGWAEGEEVTVTIGAGLQDAAGNGLKQVFAVSFWTQTSSLVLLATDPADGSTDVIRNSQVLLLFSRAMNLSSLTAATSLSVGGSSSYTFSLAQGENNWVIMTIHEVLPASSSVVVTVDASAQDQSGSTLGTPRQIGFETGVDQDTTPPQIVGVEPAHGASIDPDVGFLRLTFSEPMDTDSFEPTTFNAELLLQLAQSEVSPVWSQNNTVITVALPSGLPAGMPLDMTFADFADRNGVVQTTPFAWSARVAGTADYFPVVDESGWPFHIVHSEGEPGNATALCGDEYEAVLGIEMQLDGTFHLVEYDNFETKTASEWEVYRRTASQVEWVGFHDQGDGGGATDLTFDTPLPVLKFPLVPGSSNVSSSVTDAEFGTLDINWTYTLVGQENVDAWTDEFGGGVFWKDCWKVVIEFVVTSGVNEFFSSTETYWFSPTVGIVKHISEEESPNESACETSSDGSWRRTERNLAF